MSDDSASHTHENREKVLKRLARIEGHVRGIKRMLAEDTARPDVLVQIAAVRGAESGRADRAGGPSAQLHGQGGSRRRV